jgi:hypothetical protein
MLANRLPLLWAFAGGCVASGAALGLFREEATVVPAVAPFRNAEPHADSADPNGVEPAPSDADARRSLENNAADDDTEPKTDPGSSVAEVLSRLEAAYRQGLPSAAAPDEPAAPNAAAPTNDATSRTTPEPADTTAASVAAMHPPDSAPQLSSPPAAAAEPTPERVVSAPVAPAPVAPAVIARNDAPPRGISVGDVHVGDVHQNTQVGAVHQGDVYAVQQQLMVLQYLQLVAQSPHVRLAAPAHDPRQRATRRPHAFSLPLTNPDNPWGFDFPPTVLVK